MIRRHVVIRWVVAGAVCLGLAGGARADGLVQKAGKSAVQGAVKGAEDTLDAGKLTRGAKEVTKGVLDGAADAAPMVTSQIVNQANNNKKAMGKVARQVTTDAVEGAFGATVVEMNRAIGPNGDGPLADALTAMTERMTAAVVRGAKSQMDFHYQVWPLLLCFVVGGLSTFLFALGMLLLYLLFQRRRTPELERADMRPPRGRQRSAAQSNDIAEPAMSPAG